MRHAILFLFCLGLVASVGCQQRTAVELVGVWEGTPDTTEARRAREADKYGDLEDPNKVDSSEQPVTDWEQYDATVTFNFLSQEQVTVSMQGQTNPVEGSWQLIQAGPALCTIEIETATGSEGENEIRRYRLELDRIEGQLEGFRLSEAGADRRLGALYFRRQGQ